MSQHVRYLPRSIHPVRDQLRHRYCHGQAMVEYLVVCGALMVTLGIGMADNTSVLWQLVDAFQAAYRNFSYAISLPG